MEKTLARILVVDLKRSLKPLLDRFNATGRYEFACADSLRSLRMFMRWNPDVILLQVPEERTAAEEAFECLDALKEELPVVVLSEAADMNLYLVALTRGAFDYVTSYTPVDEIMRSLNEAVRWQRTKAA